VTCSNCGRHVREPEAESLGWRYWSDGKELHLICPLCAHREFRPDAPASGEAWGKSSEGSPQVAEDPAWAHNRRMDACSHCGDAVERSFRFCPWCATPLRTKLVEWFPSHALVDGDREKALRVSRYLGSDGRPPQVRFSIWNGDRADAAVSLADEEAARLAAFVAPPSTVASARPSLIEHLRESLRL
jgi:hypothetical protein